MKLKLRRELRGVHAEAESFRRLPDQWSSKALCRNDVYILERSDRSDSHILQYLFWSYYIITFASALSASVSTSAIIHLDAKFSSFQGL
jgi:hypothetical protein